MDSPNLLQLLREKAEAVQVVVQEVPDLAQACRYAVDLTRSQGGATLAAPGWDPGTLPVLQDLCREANLELLTENLREQASRLHTGLTLADFGLAETGTLVLESTSEDRRLATMLTETHVAVLPTSRLKPEVGAIEGELHGLMASPPRYLAFITGASRTADIERILTLGVHGPLELHLLLLKD
jgi:L-lactate dehydrogenase complex protein LldG